MGANEGCVRTNESLCDCSQTYVELCTMSGYRGSQIMVSWITEGI